MSCDSPTQEGVQSRRLKRFTVLGVVLVTGFGVMALAAWYYRVHLVWLYQARRLGLQEVQAIPDRPMPVTPLPSDWVRCRVGGIELSLPPELANNKVAAAKDGNIVKFQHGSQAVTIVSPKDMAEFAKFLRVVSELCPGSPRFTLPRLKLVYYGTSSDDFSWSMTPEEVRWHAFCMSNGKLVRPESNGRTESFFRDDFDEIVHFGRGHAEFDWQSNDRMYGSYMYFFYDDDEFDPTWIRAVCQSIKLSSTTDEETPSSRVAV